MVVAAPVGRDVPNCVLQVVDHQDQAKRVRGGPILGVRSVQHGMAAEVRDRIAPRELLQQDARDERPGEISGGHPDGERARDVALEHRAGHLSAVAHEIRDDALKLRQQGRNRQDEPLQVCRRLQPLRGLEHDEAEVEAVRP